MMLGKGHLHLALALWLLSTFCRAQNADETVPGQGAIETLLLDRFLAAESSGRQFIKNPLSSALGPFQFIESTFLDIVRRKLPDVAAGKSDEEILRLRVDPKVSREAALIYIRESAKFFAAHNVPVTATNLRLAFFAGQTGALRVLAAKTDEPLNSVLSEKTMAANPWLGALTAGQLIEKSRRIADGIGTVAVDAPAESPLGQQLTGGTQAAGGTGRPGAQAAAAKIAVHCNLKLPSCRKWLALAEKRFQVAQVKILPPAATLVRDNAR